MTKPIRIMLYLLIALIVTGLLAYLAVLKTGPGRNFVAGIAQDQIRKALGGPAKIGRLEGNLPNTIILYDVALNDDSNPQTPPFVTLDEVKLEWKPLALLRNRIRVSQIRVAGMDLNRLPALPDNEKDKPAEPLSLPQSLPDIAIDRVQLRDITISEAVIGQRVTLSGDGQVRTEGRFAEIDFSAATKEQTDEIRLAGKIDLEEKVFDIDSAINGSTDGLIAALTRAGGPVDITIKGRAEDKTAIGTMTADLATYGTANLSLSAPMIRDTLVRLKGTLRPGPGFADIADTTGETVSFALSAKPAGDGARVDIESLVLAAGSARGTLSWEDNEDILGALSGQLEVDLSPERLPEIQDILGDSLTADFQLSEQKGELPYRLSLAARASNAALRVEDGFTDLAGRFQGRVSLMSDGGFKAVPLLEDGGSASAELRLDESAINARDVTVRLERGLRASGSARYGLKDEQLRTQLQTRLTVTALESLLPALEPSGDLTATIKLDGTVNRFSLDGVIDAPALTIDGKQLSASQLNAQLQGLPNAPSGTLIGRALEGPGRLNAQLESTPALLQLTMLDLRGAAFSLVGDGSLNRNKNRLAIDLTYEGDKGAEPVPGVPLAGMIEIAGRLGPAGDSGSQNEGLRIRGQSIAFRDLLIDTLKADAKGSLDAFSFSASLDRLRQNEQELARDLSLAGGFATAGTPEIGLTRFETLLLSQTPITLRTPTTLRLGEATRLDPFQLGWGDKGEISGEGTFSATRWQADLDLKNVIIPMTDGLIDATFYLDTDQNRHAAGDFRLSLPEALTDGEAPPSLSGTMVWADDQLRLSDTSSDGSALSFDAALPLRLIRGPSLSTKFEGNISGEVRYDGRVETLTAFIPGPAQGLEGQLDAGVTLAGTIASPQLAGQLAFADCAFTDPATGLSMVGLTAEADAEIGTNGSDITFSAGGRGAGQSASDNAITPLFIEGRLKLGEAENLSTDITLDDLILAASPVEDIRLSGGINVNGPLTDIKATGEITIDEMDVEVITPETTGLVDIDVVVVSGADPGVNNLIAEETLSQKAGESSDPKASSFAYDVDIVADDRLFVRGRGLESEWSADLTVRNNGSEPLVLGAVSLVRGTFDFAGRRFDVTTGEILFDRLSPNDPVIDLAADYETADGLVATVSVSGRSSGPTVELTSTPSRPQNDIMALVLFGKPTEQLSAVESLQTAQALASLGGVGPFGGGGGGIVGSLRQSTGLDLLNVDLDGPGGAASLTAGKYLADGLFVSATQDVNGNNGSIRVEYELTDNITVESRVRADGDQTVSANYKKDF